MPIVNHRISRCRVAQRRALPSFRRCSRFAGFFLLACLGLSLLAGPAPVLGQKGKKKASPQDQMKFGVTMAQRGLWSEALFRFKQADRKAPNDPRTLNNMAICFEALGLFDQALEHYRRALKADSTNKTLRRNYARFVEFYQAFKPPETTEDEDKDEAEAVSG